MNRTIAYTALIGIMAATGSVYAESNTTQTDVESAAASGQIEMKNSDVTSMQRDVMSSTTQSARNLVEEADRTRQLDSFLAVVDASGLYSELSTGGPYTILAPSDEAFKRLPAGTLQYMMGDPEMMKEFVNAHIVKGKVSGSDLGRQGAEHNDLNGARLSVNSDGEKTRVSGAEVSKADINASNGTVHLIDRVILPDDVRNGLAVNWTDEELQRVERDYEGESRQTASIQN